MIFEQSISEWMGDEFAVGIEVAAIFKVLYHFTADGDEKFLDLLVGDGV